MSEAVSPNNPLVTTEIKSEVDLHVEAEQFVRILSGLIELLEAIDEDSGPFVEAGFRQHDVKHMENAFSLGKRVLEHEQFEAFKEEGWSAIPIRLRVTAREYLAAHSILFDVEMDPPADPSEYLLGDRNAALESGS